MSEFIVVTQKPAGVTFDMAGGDFDLEMESLGSINAKIIEVDAKNEDEFIKSAKNADAIIARGRVITKKIIDSLNNCKVIALGSVGADTVDVKAATERSIPVTHVPDVFIEEVGDHTMMLLLSTFRRLTIMHNYSINGRWSEGRPLLSNYPRLMGQTLGFVSFGHVARATAVRAKAFGLRMLAYDPYIEEINMTRYDVEPVGLFELL